MYFITFDLQNSEQLLMLILYGVEKSGVSSNMTSCMLNERIWYASTSFMSETKSVCKTDV